MRWWETFLAMGISVLAGIAFNATPVKVWQTTLLLCISVQLDHLHRGKPHPSEKK